MKKFTKIIALFLAVAMMFSGCATIEFKDVIKSDGSVEEYVKIEIDRETYDNEAIKNSQGLLKTPDDVKKALEQMMEETNVTSDASFKLEVVTKDDGKEYYVVDESVKSKIDKDNKYVYLGGLWGINDMYLDIDTVYITYDAEAFSEMVEMMMGQDMSLFNNCPIKYTFELPNDIVVTEGVKVDSDNPRVVSFDIPTNGKGTIFATSNKNKTSSMIKAEIDNYWDALEFEIKSTKIKSLKVKSVKKKKGSVTLKFKKIKGAKYEVQYSTSKKFKKKVTKTKKVKKTSVTIKNLKKGKKYYFRVRAYKKIGGEKVYTEYSTRKSIKVVKKSKKK